MYVQELLSVHMHMCANMCLQVHVCIYVYTFVRMCLCACVCIGVWVCVHVSVHVWVCAYTLLIFSAFPLTWTSSDARESKKLSGFAPEFRAILLSGSVP